MINLPRSNENALDLQVAYSREPDEEMSEAVVNAFLALDIDVFDKQTRLDDWIDTDIFRTLEWHAHRPLSLCVRIWDHRVTLTSEEIRIYR